MKRFFLISVMILVTLLQADENGLDISEMKIKIASGKSSAIFQLYETAAAKELYEQLPLTLELSNFRDAQWMFYPPEKLSVKPNEAYHEGKKGELSYYAPWGDAFMLYKDFYAGDEMHRLGKCIAGIDAIAGMSGSVMITKEKKDFNTGDKMQISVTSNGQTVIFKLNDSQAAKELYAQLPLDIEVENYSHNEKIFYPPNKLATNDTPEANAKNGTLAYYAPWGDVVMFYKDFGSAGGLYDLGEAISGKEHIPNIFGTVRIEKK